MAGVFDNGGYIGVAGEYDLGGLWTLDSTDNRVLRNNLALYLDAGNNNSYTGTGTTWFDLSGNNRNATINGAPTFTSPYFSGFSDTIYFSLSNAGLVPRTNDFTYSCWVWFNAFDTLDTIFENGSWTDTLLWRYENNTTLALYAESALAGTTSWVAAANTWYFMTLVRSSGTVSTYINGSLVGTPFTMTTDINLANTNLFLMRSQHTTGQSINGRLSVFSIYSAALTVAQINQNFNATRTRFGV